MRRLTLHASALNDEEYKFYTTSIVDLAFCDSSRYDENTTRDDTFYEQMTISVREVRAWLRGRYPDIPLEHIDAVRPTFIVLFQALIVADNLPPYLNLRF